ncbi:MAG: S24/S26 family peptidase [Chthonomonadales bacterium]|nr:S24/S26 family peptidase [Chthonomonadales bacterium]
MRSEEDRAHMSRSRWPRTRVHDDGVRAGARLPVDGCSMWPLIAPGDTLELEWAASPVRVGDVVVFRAGGETVVHRVVEMRRGTDPAEPGLLLITKGDRAARCDPPVGCGAVLGRVAVVHSRRGALYPHVVPAGWLCRLTARVSRLQARLITPLAGACPWSRPGCLPLRAWRRLILLAGWAPAWALGQAAWSAARCAAVADSALLALERRRARRER